MDTSPNPRGTTYGVPARRKEITARLAEAYSRDMLDQREFESRLERAEAAGTIEDLEALVADFGNTSPQSPLPVPAHDRTLTVLSNQHHILVPGHQEGLHAISFVGDIKVDLRAFRGSGKTLVVKVSGFLGDVGIRVPAGTVVTHRPQLILGEFRHVLAKKPGQARQLWDRLFGGQQRVPESPFPPSGSPPTLVIEGFRVLGDITVEEAPE